MQIKIAETPLHKNQRISEEEHDINELELLNEHDENQSDEENDEGLNDGGETSEDDLFNEDQDENESSQNSLSKTKSNQNLPKRKIVAPVKTPRRVENWSMPKLSLLEDPPAARVKIDEKEIRKKADITLELS